MLSEKIYEIKDFIISKITLILIIILISIIGVILIFNKPKNKKEEVVQLKKEIKEETKKEKQEENKVKVDIKGYINTPGLYEVLESSRVMDVINMAGGLKNDADTSVINLSKKVFDEMVIYVYSKNDVNNFIKTKEEESKKDEKCIVDANLKNDACITKEKRLENTVTVTTIPSNNEIKGNNNSKISLNNSSKEELMTLTGIGESKAIAIIKYREENNGFKSLEEIMNISGIGEKVFAKIKDSITL